MFYDSELNFFQSLLKNFHLFPLIFSPNEKDFSEFDGGFRKILGLGSAYEDAKNFFTKKIKPNRIYRVFDEFYCCYIFLLLPDSIPASVMMIGPYITTKLNHQRLVQITEKYTIPAQLFSMTKHYFYSIPYLDNENFLTAALNTLGEKMWGDIGNFSSEILDLDYQKPLFPVTLSSEIIDNCAALFNIQSIENRYSIENELLHAVSQGLSHKAELIFHKITTYPTEKEISDSLGNFQNHCIILNTLLRKAAEKGAVHPYYIDKLFRNFANKTETITTRENSLQLQRDMLHKYCLLVRNHSMRGYSLLVQKVIIQIDSDLTADLTLNTLAKNLSVNASYLSNLFKKETGTTLTEYVNRKRMEYGIFLLNSTILQIQTIAQHCGIPDVNYFTKLFKKYYNKTPKEYRAGILNG